MKRMQTVGCVWASISVAAACGGSSSETPFPQAPIETALEQRHQAVFDEEGVEAPPRAVPPTAETRSNGVLSPPVQRDVSPSAPTGPATPGPAIESAPAANTAADDPVKTDSSN